MLLLDEPSGGLDVGAKRRMWNALAQRAGMDIDGKAAWMGGGGGGTMCFMFIESCAARCIPEMGYLKSLVMGAEVKG